MKNKGFCISGQTYNPGEISNSGEDKHFFTEKTFRLKGKIFHSFQISIIPMIRTTILGKLENEKILKVRYAISSEKANDICALENAIIKVTTGYYESFSAPLFSLKLIEEDLDIKITKDDFVEIYYPENFKVSKPATMIINLECKFIDRDPI